MFFLKSLFRKEFSKREEDTLYLSTSAVKKCSLFRYEYDQYRHASGLLIITSEFDEALLVQRARFMSYSKMWSNPGGYRKTLDDIGDDSQTVLEPSLDCAIYETIEELGRLPSGRIRKAPHMITKPNGCTYETFVLEVKASERNRFQPSLDYDELQDWRWFPVEGLTEREDIHPGLRQFFREYRF